MPDFLNPEYYDTNDIHPEAPNKPLLIELFERENAQNERLWMFFTEMIESSDYKPMSREAIKPRTLRNKRPKAKRSEEGPAIDNPESREFMDGYKEFLKDEFAQS